LLAGLGRDGLRLSDVAPARHERFEPSGSGDFEYIEIGSLGADGTAATESVATAEAPSRATQHVRGGDIITSTVRPIRRLTALIAPDQDGAVCSSGFVVLQPQSINGEVLLTYLRLPLVCELMDLHSSATMYPAISESDLLALPIPAIATSVQAQVQQAVHQSAQARQRATRLLEAAKRAVEIAIEDSESRA
jgi:type I restriction enzyme S subunit